MAPKRKGNDSSSDAAGGGRVTRSSSRLSNSSVGKPVEPPKRKKAKTSTIACPKTIVIEHCKQCNAFKTRAFQVKDGLEKSVKGVNVVVNPEKPRRGCFEIREEGGEIFLSLQDMKRPFPPLKALDMDKLISDIVQKME